jgi:glycosyltransferase involved in cell wall biosynthesis
MLKRILIIGNPQKHPSSEAFLQKFVNIMKDINNEVYLISGDKPPVFANVHWIKIDAVSNKGFIIRILDFIKIQFQIIGLSWKFRSNYDSVIILPTSYVLPSIFLSLIRKNVGTFVAQKPNFVFMILSRLNLLISKVLIIESDDVAKKWNILKHKNKIYNGGLYVDSEFSYKKNINERKKLVGYIGRLSKEKGVLNLLYAIPDVLNDIKDLKFLIAGSGNLFEDISKFVNDNDLSGDIDFIKWIPHNELSKYLNQLTLLVLPSYTEGLPNIVLESMACGTPVLATSVGGIPDVVINNQTGFILNDNTPKSIEKNIYNILNYKKLDEISKNSIKKIENDYSFKKANERWKLIIDYLNTNK